MKLKIFLAAALALGAAGPATAQPRGTDKAPFGCDAYAGAVCHFQIFYQRGDRHVVLPAGMRVTVPELRIGRDSYCVRQNKRPAHDCARKTVNASYNN